MNRSNEHDNHNEEKVTSEKQKLQRKVDFIHAQGTPPPEGK